MPKIHDNIAYKYLNLISLAHKVKENSYSPYSSYRVGAALLTKNGETIVGCNVENAVYGLTLCAERAALGAAVTQGCRPGDFEAIAIASNGSDFSPCGSCRQFLHEFGPDIKVIFEFEGETVVALVADLLPRGFKQ